MSDEVEPVFTKESALKTIAELKADNAELKEAKTIEVEKKVEVYVDREISQLHSQSDTLGELSKSLSKCQGEFQAVQKDTEGYGYNFADLNAVIKASAPIFTKHKLSISQGICSRMHGNLLLTGVRTTLMHESGEWIASEAYMPTTKTKLNTTVQMFGVNSSYLRRYQYQAVLGLATTDNDGSDK